MLFDADESAVGGARGTMSVAAGVVTQNLDLLTEGRVQVRIPSIDAEVWARLVAPGAGPGAGLFYVPRVDDEVLVAFGDDNPQDAFVIGGLWNVRDRVPVTDPVTALTTRTLRSGVAQGVGHEIELDDLQQSVTITTSTRQKIVLDPLKIELTNLAGTVSITLDNTTQTVSLTAAKAIELKAAQITLTGATVEINGTAATTVKSAGACSVTAPIVKIN